MNRRDFLKNVSMGIAGVGIGVPGLLLAKPEKDIVKLGDLKHFYVEWEIDSRKNYIERHVSPALQALKNLCDIWFKKGYMSFYRDMPAPCKNYTKYKYRGMCCSYVEVFDILTLQEFARIDVMVGKPV